MLKFVLLGAIGYFDSVNNSKCMKPSFGITFEWVLLSILFHYVSAPFKIAVLGYVVKSVILKPLKW